MAAIVVEIFRGELGQSTRWEHPHRFLIQREPDEERRQVHDLSREPFGGERGREVPVQDLERDGSVVVFIDGEIDRSHAAAAELTLDAVASREGFE